MTITPAEVEAIRVEQISISLQLVPLYVNDPYRHAMWSRRAWLHQHYRCGEVYDGTDAVDSWRILVARGAVLEPAA